MASELPETQTPAAEPRPEPEPAPAASERGVMIPSRGERPAAERLLMRIIATIGIVAIGVAIAAIMRSQNSQGWLIGLVVGIESVVLAAILWSSRRM
jgi:hypothetical protein